MFAKRSNLPVYLALVLALPLFLVALQSSSLANERPQQHKLKTSSVVTSGGSGVPDSSGNVGTDAATSFERWPGGIEQKQASGSTEKSIWLWALVPVGVLIAVGVLLGWIRYGAYALCIAGGLLAVASTWRLDEWTRRHTNRYYLGFDLVPSADKAGNTLDKGEWEASARTAAGEMRTFVLVLAGLLFLSMLLSAYLRTRRAPLDTPLPPGSTSRLELVTAQSELTRGRGAGGP